jgi:dihydrofolate reductase
MGIVRLEITTSLDGFIAGPDDDVERLHQWIFGGDIVVKSGGDEYRLRTHADADIVRESVRNKGAVVMGKRTFDLAEGPWGKEPPFEVPCFVLTHQARPKIAKGRTTFTFVTDGIDAAIDQATTAATGKDVTVMGGASVAQQALAAGRLDELDLHVVPLLLGNGIRLFPTGRAIELEQTRIVASDGVTHIRYAVARRAH